MNQKNGNLSKFSTQKLIIQTEPKERNIIPFEPISRERIILTAQDLNNRHKLLDFISDKKKLSLKSFFDHKGTKSFLKGKNEAMKRIELNEIIDEEIKNKKSPKNNKKIKHRKSADYINDYSNYNEILIKEEPNIKKKCKKYKSIAGLSKGPRNKLNKIKEKFEDFELEKLLWQPLSPTNKRKRRKQNENKKSKKDKKTFNIDKSISSITTIDSKLFNINKNYDNYKSGLSKEEDKIIKEILFELDVNKK